MLHESKNFRNSIEVYPFSSGEFSIYLSSHILTLFIKILVSITTRLTLQMTCVFGPINVVRAGGGGVAVLARQEYICRQGAMRFRVMSWDSQQDRDIATFLCIWTFED